jgi:hypothetical protein
MTYLTGYVARSGRKLTVFAALALACLSVAAVKPQLAHAQGCSGWISPSHWFGCAEEGEYTILAVGINAGGGNHHDCGNVFKYSGGTYTWPFEWRCSSGTFYPEFPGGHGLLHPAFYNDGSAEVNGFVIGNP